MTGWPPRYIRHLCCAHFQCPRTEIVALKIVPQFNHFNSLNSPQHSALRSTRVNAAKMEAGGGPKTGSVANTTTVPAPTESHATEDPVVLRIAYTGTAPDTHDKDARIVWRDDVVDNEGMKKKSSKSVSSRLFSSLVYRCDCVCGRSVTLTHAKECCVFHRRRQWGESDSSSSESSDDNGRGGDRHRRKARHHSCDKNSHHHGQRCHDRRDSRGSDSRDSSRPHGNSPPSCDHCNPSGSGGTNSGSDRNKPATPL